MNLMKKLFYKKKILVIGVFVFLTYVFLYLWSIDHFLFGEFDEIASVSWLANWRALIFRSRSPLTLNHWDISSCSNP